MKFLVVISAIVFAAHGAPQVLYGGLGYGYGLGLGGYPYGLGHAAPAVVAAPPSEDEEPTVEVAAAPAIPYAGLPYGLPYAGLPFSGLPHAGLPHAGLPHYGLPYVGLLYTVPGLPKLELPAAPAISYSLGGVSFIVPAVAVAAAECLRLLGQQEVQA